MSFALRTGKRIFRIGQWEDHAGSQKVVEVRLYGFRAMRADRQTDKQTLKETYSVTVLRKMFRTHGTTLTPTTYYFAPVTGCKEIVMSMSVCVFVCASVCPLTAELHQIFCVCFLWPWLGPPPTALRYIM